MPISNPSMPSVPDGLHVEDLTLDGTALLITARTTAAQASCRVCGRASTRVHSTYWRMFGELATRIEEGRSEEVIAGVVARTSSELLVMGTHARTGIRRAHQGSDTEAVLAAGGADVLVVPPPRPSSCSGSGRPGKPSSVRAERPALRVVTV